MEAILVALVTGRMHFLEIETFEALAFYDLRQYLLLMFVEFRRGQVFQDLEDMLNVVYVKKIVEGIQKHAQTVRFIFNE